MKMVDFRTYKAPIKIQQLKKENWWNSTSAKLDFLSFYWRKLMNPPFHSVIQRALRSNVRFCSMCFSSFGWCFGKKHDIKPLDLSPRMMQSPPRLRNLWMQGPTRPIRHCFHRLMGWMILKWNPTNFGSRLFVSENYEGEVEIFRNLRGTWNFGPKLKIQAGRTTY